MGAAMAGMAVTMAAMMGPTAAPFFLAYGRDTRRPVAVATLVLLYVAVWGAIGFVLASFMNQVMLPSPLLTATIAFALAIGYAFSPWGRWAREQCRQMSVQQPRGPRFRDAVADGAGYAACCVVCSTGVMLVVIVLGMTNPLVLVGGAALLLAYKLTPWPAGQRVRPRSL